MATEAICSIEDCGKPICNNARGWCTAHYTRWRRHGDPLGGGTPHGEPLRYLNEVASAYDGDDCLTWPYSRAGTGYGQVRIGDRCAPAHRLACEIRHGPPPTPEHEAAHSCGNGHEGCVNPNHLRWATTKENEADKLVHGTHNRGEHCGNAKLTERDVVEIRRLAGRVTQAALAERFGVGQDTISRTINRKRWAWMD